MNRIFILIILSLVSILCAQKSFTIMSYNVLYGFNHRNKIEEGANWINKQSPDVVALQELNGFTQIKLEEVAKKWGHNYSVILKEDGFPVGISSKTPIKVLECKIKGLHHGFLHCKTAGIHFIIVHLSPFKYTVRQMEARKIAKIVKPLLRDGENVIVLGDFNALSPDDKKYIDSHPELLIFAKNVAKNNKTIKNLNNNDFDYTVIQKLFNDGLIDPMYRLLKDTEELKGVKPFGIPLDLKIATKKKPVAMRIDYILLDKKLDDKCFFATRPQNGIVNHISDHYPVIIKLDYTANEN